MKMGKSIKKSKRAGDVTVMEFSFRCIGVRTRARTLALQRDAAASMQKADPSCLQFRSRRLEKPPFLSSLARTADQDTGKRTQSQEPNGSTKLRGVLDDGDEEAVNSDRPHTVFVKSGASETKVPVATGELPLLSVEKRDIERETGAEASFGENILDLDDRDSSGSTRETCSLMGSSASLDAPGSTTRQSENSRRVCQEALQEAQQRVAFPTWMEMEEFFAGLEQKQQKRFTEKYNYDLVNDFPLPGRYEWIRLCP